MAHCPYDQLRDLESVFRVIRAWPGMREPKPGIFYFKRVPFLHFHIKDGVRWADVRVGKTWGPKVDVALRSTAVTRVGFLKMVEKRYRAFVKA
jgi:hypothetical protein